MQSSFCTKKKFLPWGMCVEPICSDSESKELSVVNFSSEKRAGRLSVVNIMASSFRAVQGVTFYYLVIICSAETL